MLTREQRLDRLDDLTRRGMIVRRKWTDGERACLLAALSPEAGQAKDANACPADVLPPWFAALTPEIDDCTSKAYWPEMVREYGRVVRRAAVLTSNDWRQLDFASRAIALRVSLPHANATKPIIDRVLAMCERKAKGDRVLVAEWREAARAAAGAQEAEFAAAAAARAAESSAAAHCVAAAARAATHSVVAAAARRGRRRAYDAAAAAVWDAIAKGVLAAIDARCAEREASC